MVTPKKQMTTMPTRALRNQSKNLAVAPRRALSITTTETTARMAKDTPSFVVGNCPVSWNAASAGKPFGNRFLSSAS